MGISDAIFELSCSQTNPETNPGKNITFLAEVMKDSIIQTYRG